MTGRKRRCGWFDAALLRYASRINGLTELFITKLDVLSGFPTLQICTGYRAEGQVFDDFPPHQSLFHKAEPIYEEHEGWDEEIDEAQSFEDLPKQARDYVGRIQELAGVPVSVVSVGPPGNRACRSDEGPRRRRRRTRARAGVGPLAQPGRGTPCGGSGNPGIAQIADCVPVPADDVGGLTELAAREAVDLVVVGPEAPLVAGLADRLRERGIATFGPDAAAARVEGSKAWAKSLMEAGGIPTARSGTFTDLDAAVTFVDELGGRAVVKADGLAAGKGVTVALDRETAVRALRDCLEDAVFGSAGATVVVEEVLEGAEVSAFSLCDGRTVVPLALSQDFKRVGEGDTGPNTGGMGAYSPLPFVDAATEAAIWDVAERTVQTMASQGVTYRGLLYTGLMLTADGPKVLEYNCRFGDPETEAVIPRLGTDLAELLNACATGSLEDMKVDWLPDAAVTVVLASGGYPGAYETGLPHRRARGGRRRGGRRGVPRGDRRAGR